MRKTLLLISAVFAMLAAVSCNKEEINKIDTPQTSVESLEFIAYTDVATKTTLNGLYTEWVEGDMIDINGCPYVATENGQSVTITKENEEYKNPEAPYFAGYPWNSILNVGDGYACLASEHILSPGNICEDVISIAYSESDAVLEFKNVVSLIKFQVPFEVQEVRISADEPLAGYFYVDYNDGEPIVTEVSEGKNKLVLTASEGTFVVGTDYYVPVLPGKKTNLTVTIDGTVVATAASLTLNRSFIHDLKKLPTHSGWALPGGHNEWSTTSNYLYSEGDYYVVKNVSGLNSGFKFCHEEFGWKGVGSTDPVSVGQWHKLNGEANISLEDGSAYYDIYMTKDGKQFQAVAAGSPAPEAPIVVADYWGIIGSMTGSNWATDLKLTEEGDYLVYKGISLTASDEFKFRKNGEYTEQKIASATAKADIEYDLIDAGSNNMKVAAAGTYDVYVKKDLTKVYFMTTGKTPQEATVPSTYKFYIQTTSVSWSQYYLYAWGGYATGNWPGVKLSNKENAPDSKGSCYYVEIPIGTNIVNFIVNDNSGKQTKDLTSAKLTKLSTGDYFYKLVSGDIKQ